MRHLNLWCAAVWIVIITPLIAFTFVPASDLPSHVAISAVMLRLLQHDPVTLTYFAWHPQPVPYYLAYALLAPCVAWAGPFGGAKMFLVILAALHVVAMRCLMRAASLPAWTLLGSVFVFYSPLFFWGFVSTQMAIPWIMLLLWALLRHEQSTQRRYLVAAVACTTLATAAHAVVLLACAVAWAAWAILAPRRRFGVLLGLGVGGIAGAWRVIPGLTEVQFETPRSAALHVLTHLSAFDAGPGRFAHLAFVAWVIHMITRQGTVESAPRRLGELFAGGMCMLFLFVPLNMVWGDSPAWGLNFRFLTLAEVGLLLCLTPRDDTAVTPSLTSSVTGVALVVVFMAALGRLWWQFDTAARPINDVVAAMEPERTVQARVDARPFADAWPPLAQNLKYYYLASRSGFEDGIFAGGHLPILINDAAPRAAADGGIGHFHYVLIQDTPDILAKTATPAGAKLRLATGMWRLYERQ